MRSRPSTWAIDNPIPVAVIFIVLIVAGVADYRALPVKLLPDVSFPVVQITVTFPGAAASEVETQITREIEAAVSNISGVEHVQSTVSLGLSSTVVESEIGEDLQRATDEVRAAVDRIRGDLPHGIEEPIVERFDVDGQPILTYAVAASSVSDIELSRFIDDTIAHRLITERGVAQVTRVGGVDREINVTLDPERLEAFGLTAPAVNDALRGSSLDGQPVVGFQVMKTKTASGVAVETNVARAVTALQATHPELEFRLIVSTAASTRASFSATVHALVHGMLLAAIVVFFFLRDWRATALAAAAIPISRVQAGQTSWQAARDALSIPVVSLTESAMLVACTLGRRFGVITMDMPSVVLVERCLESYRLEDRAIRHRPVRSPGFYEETTRWFSDPQYLRSKVIPRFEEVARGMIEDGAEVIVTACGNYAAFPIHGYSRIGEPDVPMVEGFVAATHMAAMLGNMRRAFGLSTSKQRSYKGGRTRARRPDARTMARRRSPVVAETLATRASPRAPIALPLPGSQRYAMLAAPMKSNSVTVRAKPPALRRRPLGQRRRGRPARISREAIIATSMEILATTYVDDFMVKTVAERLGTVPMAIYNYFASREELLEAVADEVCLAFKPPKPKEDWRATLLAWLWALKRHADRHPVIHNVIGIDGHVSAGWFRIVAPIVKLLADIGLREKKLALAAYLFMSGAASMIYIEAASAATRKSMSFAHFERLSPDEQQMMIAHGSYVAELTEKDVLDAGFAQLIKGIELFL